LGCVLLRSSGRLDAPEAEVGSWIGGAFAQGSYAAVYPEPSDLYLERAAEVDPSSGAFVFDEDDCVVLRDSSILIRWEEVEYLEFIDG
jgi:uncharacterized protein DUF6338